MRTSTSPPSPESRKILNPIVTGLAMVGALCAGCRKDANNAMQEGATAWHTTLVTDSSAEQGTEKNPALGILPDNSNAFPFNRDEAGINSYCCIGTANGLIGVTLPSKVRGPYNMEIVNERYETNNAGFEVITQNGPMESSNGTTHVRLAPNTKLMLLYRKLEGMGLGPVERMYNFSGTPLSDDIIAEIQTLHETKEAILSRIFSQHEGIFEVSNEQAEEVKNALREALSISSQYNLQLSGGPFNKGIMMEEPIQMKISGNNKEVTVIVDITTKAVVVGNRMCTTKQEIAQTLSLLLE
jgi:hypothetical protein